MADELNHNGINSMDSVIPFTGANGVDGGDNSGSDKSDASDVTVTPGSLSSGGLRLVARVARPEPNSAGPAAKPDQLANQFYAERMSMDHPGDPLDRFAPSRGSDDVFLPQPVGAHDAGYRCPYDLPECCEPFADGVEGSAMFGLFFLACFDVYVTAVLLKTRGELLTLFLIRYIVQPVLVALLLGIQLLFYYFLFYRVLVKELIPYSFPNELAWCRSMIAKGNNMFNRRMPAFTIGTNWFRNYKNRFRRARNAVVETPRNWFNAVFARQGPAAPVHEEIEMEAISG
ncbi:uncharacterized protein SPSK_00874 [Sporothrix schenckii 1099-18]|uniref:Uncharacterized protein n=1 Tax=Sporothrix schenckii 1099-18 TaxID=1397361 RepID=A0A0F2LYX9_SPOSC|nr:uncharacterized protein SPSK_00874 [Sporothrix schenckii 1099-18]KJR81710.1 hypothetical protein SPSK_00874 [Sporothrix schenckii 1099-18]